MPIFSLQKQRQIVNSLREKILQEWQLIPDCEELAPSYTTENGALRADMRFGYDCLIIELSFTGAGNARLKKVVRYDTAEHMAANAASLLAVARFCVTGLKEGAGCN